MNDFNNQQYYPQYGYNMGRYYNGRGDSQMNNQQTNYQQQMLNQPLQQGLKVGRVNGRDGADAYFIMPNSEVLLLDTKDPIVWHKLTDSAGYSTVAGFKITPLEDNVHKEQYDYYALEQRVKILEELLEGMTYDRPEQQNIQPATTSIQQSNAGGFKPKQHNTK